MWAAHCLEILGYDRAEKLIHEADEIYLKFGADKKVYGIDDYQAIEQIRTKAIQANLKLIECPIRHLGTEEGYKIIPVSRSICWSRA